MAVSTTALGAIALVVAISAFLHNLTRVKVDPREPPVVYSKIPLLGHLIGMLIEGPLYIKKISERCRHPIFTLPMLSGRVYVVTSPTLAVAVQRAASTLDFDELIVEVSPRLVGSSAETRSILRDPLAKQEGRKRMVTKSHDVINPPLAAHKMRDISQNQLNHFSDYFNSFKDGDEVDIYKSVTREVSAASMRSFYGPQNPFAVHPELLEKYWEWDEGVIGYTVGVFPKITARKAYYALEACVQGFIEYTEKGLHSQAHPFLQARKKMHEEEGISQHEHARLEMGISFGFNSNASITSFWMINNIFSRPDLLSQIREEIYVNAFEAPGTISASKLRDACPLLNSTWRETVRLIAPMTSARIVLEDTILADTYFLRKGSVVQIAGGVLHSDTEIWGPDASSFNARRFLYTLNGTKTDIDGSVTDSKTNTIHSGAFRGFGGGTSLCPGRHFAQLEVTSLAAVFVLGFDVQPTKGSAWDPPLDDKKFPLAVTKPVKGVRVGLKKRAGWEGVKWDLEV